MGFKLTCKKETQITKMRVYIKRALDLKITAAVT